MLPAVFAIGETGTDRKEERIGKCLPNSLGRFMIEQTDRQTDRQTERHTVVNDLMSSVKSGKNAFVLSQNRLTYSTLVHLSSRVRGLLLSGASYLVDQH